MASSEQVQEFVIAGHGNLARVKEMLAQHPELLEARSNLDETALGAAAHVGNRAVAEFLLSQGATHDICTAAMLADRAKVAELLAADPAAAQAKGAHGISLMFHAALGGDVAIAEQLHARGAAVPDNTIHAAAAHGHVDMARWLLDHGVTDLQVPNFEKKTPLAVAIGRGHTAVADLLRERGATE